MVELGKLSLNELREIAGRLAVADAAALARPELVEKLGTRLGEVVEILNAGPTDVAFAGPKPSPDGLPSAGAPEDAVPAVTSGSGPSEPVPLEPPRVPIADLPWAYEDDRLVLLVRDPRTLFTYWDFHPDTVARAGSGLSQGWPKLRLIALGRAEPEVVRELDVDLGWKAFYLYDCEPNRDYRVEVVLRGPNGEERLVGRASNVATLPPNQPSAWIDDRFARLSPDMPLPRGGAGGRSLEAEKRLHQRSYELSGGDAFATGDEASSSRGSVQGFGGRAWSGTLVKK